MNTIPLKAASFLVGAMLLVGIAAPLRADNPTPADQTGSFLRKEILGLVDKKDLPSLLKARKLGDAYLILEAEYHNLPALDRYLKSLDVQIASLRPSTYAITPPPPTGIRVTSSVPVGTILETFSKLKTMDDKARIDFLNSTGLDLTNAIKQYQQTYPELFPSTSTPPSASEINQVLSGAAAEPQTLTQSIKDLPNRQKKAIKDAVDQIQTP